MKKQINIDVVRDFIKYEFENPNNAVIESYLNYKGYPQSYKNLSDKEILNKILNNKTYLNDVKKYCKDSIIEYLENNF